MDTRPPEAVTGIKDAGAKAWPRDGAQWPLLKTLCDAAVLGGPGRRRLLREASKKNRPLLQQVMAAALPLFCESLSSQKVETIVLSNQSKKPEAQRGWGIHLSHTASRYPKMDADLDHSGLPGAVILTGTCFRAVLMSLPCRSPEHSGAVPQRGRNDASGTRWRAG